MRGPSIANNVFGAPFPSTGGPDFGYVSGPNVPFSEWEPTGTGGPLGAMAAFTSNGIPPSSHGHVTLKSHDFVQHQYLLPPTSDGANRKLMRGMLTFVIREMDKCDNSTLVYSLAMINQLSKDQWSDFVLATTQGQYFDPEKNRFLGYMQKYGDNGLISYHKAVERNDVSGRYTDAIRGELADFHKLATQDGFCYLTLFGFLQKVNYHGCVMNTNQGESLEVLNDTDSYQHYVQANLGLAKRMLVAQVFGTSQNITTGSRTWIVLKREYCHNGKYGPFILYPGGSKEWTRPRDLNYVDEAGCVVAGHYWKVGTVIEPANWSPQYGSVQAANNTGSMTDSSDAYAAHGTLPTCYVAMGFNN